MYTDKIYTNLIRVLLNMQIKLNYDFYPDYLLFYEFITFMGNCKSLSILRFFSIYGNIKALYFQQ